MPTAQLYDLADALYRLAPWKWLHEDQLIGLRHPVTGELAHISIMGALDEHRALALYLGEDALHRFNLQQNEEYLYDLSKEDGVQLTLEARQLKVSFEERPNLAKSELAEIKAMGRKYRGRNYPIFRSFHPGRCPGFINEAEAEWLIYAMEQVIEVAPNLANDDMADLREDEKNNLEAITREFRDGNWHTTWLPLDERTYVIPSPDPDPALVAALLQYRPDLELECQFQLLANPIGLDRHNAVFPYSIMSVHAESGFVFGLDLLTVEKQSHEELVASVPDCFLHQWIKQGIRPAAIYVATHGTHEILLKVADALDVPLVREPKLPALNKAFHSAMSFINRGL